MSEIQEILTRFWDQLIAQPSGPLAFRLILQPIMATILAILDGLKDARVGRSPYSWTDTNLVGVPAVRELQRRRTRGDTDARLP